jgi:hypothetical protein
VTKKSISGAYATIQAPYRSRFAGRGDAHESQIASGTTKPVSRMRGAQGFCNGDKANEHNIE